MYTIKVPNLGLQHSWRELFMGLSRLTSPDNDKSSVDVRDRPFPPEVPIFAIQLLNLTIGAICPPITSTIPNTSSSELAYLYTGRSSPPPAVVTTSRCIDLERLRNRAPSVRSASRYLHSVDEYLRLRLPPGMPLGMPPSQFLDPGKG